MSDRECLTHMSSGVLPWRLGATLAPTAAAACCAAVRLSVANPTPNFLSGGPAFSGVVCGRLILFASLTQCVIDRRSGAYRGCVRISCSSSSRRALTSAWLPLVPTATRIEWTIWSCAARTWTGVGLWMIGGAAIGAFGRRAYAWLTRWRACACCWLKGRSSGGRLNVGARLGAGRERAGSPVSALPTWRVRVRGARLGAL
jgi:hypothetical protein